MHLEKMSKAALMDMVWSLAAAASGDADNAPAVLEKIRSEWEVIRQEVNMTRGKRMAKAVADLERAERKLATAFTRWQKARAKVRRYDKLADKAFNEIGGTYDVRDIGDGV